MTFAIGIWSSSIGGPGVVIRSPDNISPEEAVKRYLHTLKEVFNDRVKFNFTMTKSDPNFGNHDIIRCVIDDEVDGHHEIFLIGKDVIAPFTVKVPEGASIEFVANMLAS